MNLTKLLRPRSMAIIGASEKEGFGADTCKNIFNNRENLDGIYLVNPKRDHVFGHKCYNSIDEIEEKFDLAIICSPQHTVNQILRQAASKGCEAAVVFASGYSETGTAEGNKNEKELIELCHELNIVLLGPNCAGFANFVEKAISFGIFMPTREKSGKIGLVSQSGQVCCSALDLPSMKFSYIIATGNCAVVQMEDYIDFLVDDEATKVVAVYIEGFKNIQKLTAVLSKAAIKKKPVIILKNGRSEKGSQLAASHTGSLAGSDAGIQALFEKFGVIRVNDIQELLFTAIMFDTLKALPKTTKFASASISGGEAGMIADLAHLHDIKCAELHATTLEQLREIVPSYVTPNNPLDMTAIDSERMSLAFHALMQDENVGYVLVSYSLPPEVYDPLICNITDGIEKAIMKPSEKPIMLLPFVEHTRNEEVLRRLQSLGVPILPSGMYAFRLLKYLADYIEYDYHKKTLEIAVPAITEQKKTEALSENESKAILKQAGIPINEEIIVSNKEQALQAAKQLGFPLVMKVESADIQHKSDIGGVKLNIETNEEVVNAFVEINSNAAKFCPGAKVNGVLMQRMLPQGVEVIVGVNNDPQCGPMVMVGLGGVFVEVFKDVKMYPAPFSKLEALNMIESLKAFKLLSGYRGDKPSDIDALADFLVKISEFAANHKDTVKELDINPVFVYPDGEGVAVVDALLVRYQ